MTGKPGRFAIIEQFLADGITYMFGNPGTVEQGFLDALLEYPGFTYIETLQETIAVSIADGYARATKRPAIIQLHSGVGLGNGVGMLYQAKRGHAPLVVIAGDSGVRYEAMDAQMAADLVAIAEPVTKWATRVTDSSSLLRVLRRAIKIAATPPMGPVFVALPMDVLDAVVEERIFPSISLVTSVAPDAATVARAASLLAGASRPLVLIGDGIAAAGAEAELARVAELLGAEVWGVDSSEANIAADHPQFCGLTGHMFGEHSKAILATADAVLISGTYVFPEVFPALSNVFAPEARVVHVDLNAYEIAKNFPVDLGIVADPKPTLALLATALEATLDAAAKAAATARIARLSEQKARETAQQRQADEALDDSAALHMATFIRELAAALPADAMIFDEALTSSPELVRYLPPNRPGHYFQTRGGSLGVGLPGAIGLKLAHPGRTVVGFTGDGGSMYTIQALWTAAHHNIGAKFVICNNHSYKLLKLNIQQYWRERGLPEREFPVCFDLKTPDIRFDQLAQSLGVPGLRVERADQVGAAVRQALAHDGPFLLDVVVSSEVAGHVVAPRCGQ